MTTSGPLPPIWYGCGLSAWSGLLAKNWHRVHWRDYPQCFFTCLTSALNSALGLVNQVMNATPDADQLKPPIFIVGHWRTGTTHLHDLLCTDEQFTWPSNYACFMPLHFELTQPVLAGPFAMMLPAHRPMDGVSLSHDSPQEEEFALCLLGNDSPYRWLAFPNESPTFAELVDEEAKTPQKEMQWEKVYKRLLARLSRSSPNRTLVLKCPLHLFRMQRLLRGFPESKTIHIVREPIATIVSTLKMWKCMLSSQSLGKIDDAALLRRILSDYKEAHQRLNAIRKSLPAKQFVEVTLEDLVARPTAVISQIYSQLDLASPDLCNPRLLCALRRSLSYRTQRLEVSPGQLDQITNETREIASQFGYVT